MFEELYIVIDLSICYERETAVSRFNRLMTTSEINDREARMDKANTTIDGNAVVIWSTMVEGLRCGVKSIRANAVRI